MTVRSQGYELRLGLGELPKELHVGGLRLVYPQSCNALAVLGLFAEKCWRTADVRLPVAVLFATTVEILPFGFYLLFDKDLMGTLLLCILRLELMYETPAETLAVRVVADRVNDDDRHFVDRLDLL